MSETRSHLRGTGRGEINVLIVASTNFFGGPARPHHWPGFEAFFAHEPHAQTYFGVVKALLSDPRFTATIVNAEHFYRLHGPLGIGSAFAAAAGGTPDYVLLEGGAKPFCLTPSQIAAFRRHWPKACIVLLGQDEVTEFADHTWCYAEVVDLIISLDGFVGWGEAYRRRWSFMHLVPSAMYRDRTTLPVADRPVGICLFGRAKADRHQLIRSLRDSGMAVSTNIEGDGISRRVDDVEYIGVLRDAVYTIAPLQPYRGEVYHLTARIWEAMLAGSVPLVDDCPAVRAYERLFGPLTKFASHADLPRIAADLQIARRWAEGAGRSGMLDKVERYGAEALLDSWAARMQGGELRAVLDTETVLAAVTPAFPRMPIRLKKLARERLRWLRFWIKQRRFAWALAEAKQLAAMGAQRLFYG